MASMAFGGSAGKAAVGGDEKYIFKLLHIENNYTEKNRKQRIIGRFCPRVVQGLSLYLHL
jgi:hypothetical protein